MRDFYRDVLGCVVVEEEDGWIDLDAGGCKIALHAASSSAAALRKDSGPRKLAFFATDVAAARADLGSRGAKMGPVKVFGDLHLCDGDDPDGNRIQLSNRQ